MPTFDISVINETFSALHHHEGPSAEEAAQQGLKAALAIGVEEIVGGGRMFAAEVRVDAANQTVSRFIVSMGTSPLQIADE